MKKHLVCLLIMMVFGSAKTVNAQSEEEVVITFDKEVEEEESSAFVQPIEQLFKNPAFATGLASGAEAINRSIESLMDALFYSLLDNEIKVDVTDHAWFSTDLRRDVFSTSSGAYVVVDRINLGPRYSRELWNIHNVPITVGVDGSVEVMQINLRTDGMRLAEQNEIGTFRRWLNNWSGLVPLLSSVLPPSFNPNELYDPITQLETPFVFPFSADSFYDMPIGSIRSYAVSGGATTSLDLGGMLDQASRESLENLEGIKENLPYTVFMRGEHRINVLRRNENTAWVGLNKVKRVGHSISTVFGNTLAVLQGAFGARIFKWDWEWRGIPTVMFPVQVKTGQAMGDIFDQVYEFDLTNPHGREAYEAATQADFTIAHEKYRLYAEQGVETGVIFHFTRIQERDEADTKNSPNIAVLRKERTKERRAAEIEITDAEGKFYVLEARQRLEERWLDALVGEEKSTHLDSVEMKVRKVLVDPDDPRSEANELDGDWNSRWKEVKGLYGSSRTVLMSDDEYEEKMAWYRENEKRHTYVFAVDEDPLQVTLNLNIQDRYIDAEELAGYYETLGHFSKLKFKDVPVIRYRDEELQIKYRRNAFFGSPLDLPVNLHVTPTYLGRFGAQGLITFGSEQWQKVLDTPEDQKWRAFAEAFGKPEGDWGDPEYRASLLFQAENWRAFSLYPLRLFNIRFANVDAIRDAYNAIDAMNRIQAADTPLRKLHYYYQLFDAEHPTYLARALLNLSDIDKVSRRVVFSAQPKGGARASIKKEYGTLNGQAYSEGPDFPPPTRYQNATKKMAAFYLDQPREVAERPEIRTIRVEAKEIPESIRSLPPLTGDGEEVTDEEETEVGEEAGKLDRDQRHVFVKLGVSGTQPHLPAKIYVRVEQAGKIKFGKLELAEGILEVTPFVPEGPVQEVLNYEFFLTGPLSSLSNFVFDSAISSGEDLSVTIAISNGDKLFSDERVLEFRFEKGRLRPLE